MDTIVRSVKDITASDRQAIEHLLGAPLGEHQQVVIQIMPAREEQKADGEYANGTGGAAVLPEWTRVYAGLSESEIAELEKSVLSRADLTRPVG
jgi:hypothetical protein